MELAIETNIYMWIMIGGLIILGVIFAVYILGIIR